MTAEGNAQRVEEIFDGALDLSASAQAKYLDEQCGDDAALRSAVAALLEADRRAEENKLGAFTLGRKIGEGAMGAVYEAYDARLERKVAIKLVRAGSADEARALAKIAHPNVVPVHEVGSAAGQTFIVMELVEGETLTAWLARQERPWRDVLAKFIAAGRGLEAAHAAGIVHGDFKPDNVLIGKDERPRVVDFGLATTTARGSGFMGTPAYMSPEHFRGEPTDAKSDQFAFAIALYRAVFGIAPFEGDDLISLRASVLEGRARPPPPTEVPVGDAILRALALDPKDRWPSLTELLAALEAPLAVSPELDPSRARTKRRIAAALLAVAAVVSSLPPSPTTTTRGLLFLAFVALASLVIIGVVFRRMLAESVYNRRIAAIFLLVVLGFIMHRLLALKLGSRIEDILVSDAVAMAVVVAFAAIAIERWMAIVSGLALLYAVGATFFPIWAAPGFGSLLCISAVIPVLFWGRRKTHGGLSGPHRFLRTTR